MTPTDETSERAREIEGALRLLLDLHDPPSPVQRRRYAEDERGWNMMLNVAVRRGRLLLPRPEPCSVCGGTGSETVSREDCGACDGEGFKHTPRPLTETERKMWRELGRLVRREEAK